MRHFNTPSASASISEVSRSDLSRSHPTIPYSDDVTQCLRSEHFLSLRSWTLGHLSLSPLPSPTTTARQPTRRHTIYMLTRKRAYKTFVSLATWVASVGDWDLR